MVHWYVICLRFWRSPVQTLTKTTNVMELKIVVYLWQRVSISTLHAIPSHPIHLLNPSLLICRLNSWLNYIKQIHHIVWSKVSLDPGGGLNPGPFNLKLLALPTELPWFSLMIKFCFHSFTPLIRFCWGR